MVVIPLPGGSLALGPTEVEVVYMMMEAGRRQLRVDGLSMPPEIAIVLAAVEEQWRANRGAVSDVERPTSDTPASSGLMTVTEAAARVARSERTVGRWARTGRLPTARQARPGAPWVVSLDEVQEVAGVG